MRIPDYFIRILDLPPSVKGLVIPNDDGTFSIFINAIYDTKTQRKTLEHELEHLARDHFYKEQPVALQEAEASGRAGAPEAASGRRIRRYESLDAVMEYLRSVGALTEPIERLGRPL